MLQRKKTFLIRAKIIENLVIILNIIVIAFIIDMKIMSGKIDSLWLKNNVIIDQVLVAREGIGSQTQTEDWTNFQPIDLILFPPH
jgi:hypothetical protein